MGPRSRLALWDIIRELVGDGTTMLLTTQYLEEADQPADDIAVIGVGRVIAEGTADQLKAQVGGHRAQIIPAKAASEPALTETLSRYGFVTAEAVPGGRTFWVAVESGPSVLQRILTDFTTADIELLDVGIRRPTLDDVFMRLTGHKAEEGTETTELPEATGTPDQTGPPARPPAPEARPMQHPVFTVLIGSALMFLIFVPLPVPKFTSISSR